MSPAGKQAASPEREPRGSALHAPFAGLEHPLQIGFPILQQPSEHPLGQGHRAMERLGGGPFKPGPGPPGKQEDARQ